MNPYIVSAFNLVHCLVETCEENIAPHRYTSGTKIIVDIHLWYHAKNQEVVVKRLAATWNLKSYQWTFFIGMIWTLNGSFTYTWFYNTMHHSYGKYWFTELCWSPKCIFNAIQRIHSLISTPVSLERSLNNKTLKLIAVEIRFTKF